MVRGRGSARDEYRGTVNAVRLDEILTTLRDNGGLTPPLSLYNASAWRHHAIFRQP